MSLKKFKDVTTSIAPPDIKNPAYIDSLLSLDTRQNKKSILPIIGTVAAAILLIVGVTAWALIGRGIRGHKPNDDPIVPADDSAVTEPDDKNDGTKNDGDLANNKDENTVEDTEIKPAVTSLSFVEYIRYNDEQSEILLDIYKKYVIPILPDFELGTVPEKKAIIQYIELLKPKLCTDGTLTARELNDFALEYFGIVTAFKNDIDYSDGVPEIAIEIPDDVAIKHLSKLMTDDGKSAIQVGYSIADDDPVKFAKNDITYVTYITDSDGISPDFFVECKTEEPETLYVTDGHKVGSDVAVTLTDDVKNEYKTRVIEKYKALALPKYNEGKMPNATDTARWLIEMKLGPKTAAQMNGYVQDYFGMQGMVSSIPATAEIAMVYEYDKVEIISVTQFSGEFSDKTYTRIVYSCGDYEYILTYKQGNDIEPEYFVSHYYGGQYVRRAEFESEQQDFEGLKEWETSEIDYIFDPNGPTFEEYIDEAVKNGGMVVRAKKCGVSTSYVKMKDKVNPDVYFSDTPIEILQVYYGDVKVGDRINLIEEVAAYGKYLFVDSYTSNSWLETKNEYILVLEYSRSFSADGTPSYVYPNKKYHFWNSAVIGSTSESDLIQKVYIPNKAE